MSDEEFVKIKAVDLNTGKQTEWQVRRSPRPNEVTIWDLNLGFETNNISIRIERE